MHVSPAKHSFGKCDRKVWQTDRQTDRRTDRQTDRQTDDGQSDPYLSLCFTGDTTIIIMHCIYRVQSWQCTEQFGLYDVHKVTYILVQYESWPLTLKINRLIRQHIFEVLSNSPIGFVCSVNKIISMFVYCDIDLSPLTLQMKKRSFSLHSQMCAKFNEDACNRLISLVCTS